MNKYLEKAKENGLYDVIKEWLKGEPYVSTGKLQREFSIGYNTASAIFDELLLDGLIEKESSKKGNRVVDFTIGMKIYLLDYNLEIVKAWKEAFINDKDVIVIQDDFKHFMDSHDVECVVSPANSYGVMSGGYDLAITNYFGNALQYEVQKYICRNLYGEQPVGTSIIVNIPNTNKKLIHTPTMQTPQIIKDDFVIYQCMRSTLMKALEENIKSVVIPAFGGSCGRVAPINIARRMKEAYQQIISNIKK